MIVVSFEDDKGRKVIFDKIGNSYTYSQRNELMYYDESDNSYKCLDDTCLMLFKIVNQQFYLEEDYVFYINNDGYFCLLYEFCLDEKEVRLSIF